MTPLMFEPTQGMVPFRSGKSKGKAACRSKYIFSKKPQWIRE